MGVILILFCLATVLSTSNGNQLGISHQIHLLRPQTGAGGGHIDGLSCLSWRLAVETLNIMFWKTVPRECEGYVGHYMLGFQYRMDWEVVANEAFLYAQTIKIAKDGRDIWVFDIDETSLSNLPYFALHGFGVESNNSTVANAWVNKGIAPPLPESLKLYRKLLSLGFKIVFLTGRAEDLRSVTVTNLKNSGFNTWEKLILWQSSGSSYSAVAHKSLKRRDLENEGYRIQGNIGDQWSDLMGNNAGRRTFKAPNPMYFVS